MKKINFTIKGQPATKKNSSVLIKGRAMILPSKAYRAYEKEFKQQLAKLIAQGTMFRFTLPVRMTCHYYLENRKGWPDLVGLMQATADIISDERKCVEGKIQTVREWLLSDDRIITSWNGTKIAGIDKYDPRVEIEIAELEPSTAFDPYVIRQLAERQKQSLF